MCPESYRLLTLERHLRQPHGGFCLQIQVVLKLDVLSLVERDAESNHIESVGTYTGIPDLTKLACILVEI